MAFVLCLTIFYACIAAALSSPSIVPEYVAGIPVRKMQQGENWQAAPVWSIPEAPLDPKPRSVRCTTPGAACIDCETLRVCNKFHRIVIEKSCYLNPRKPFCNADHNECSAIPGSLCEDEFLL